MAVSDLERRSRQLWAGPSLFKNTCPAPLYHRPPRLRRSVRSLGAERSMPRRHQCRHAAGLCSGKHTSLLSSQQPKCEFPASKPCNSSTLQVSTAPRALPHLTSVFTSVPGTQAAVGRISLAISYGQGCRSHLQLLALSILGTQEAAGKPRREQQ